ncbi:hypothetical protein Sjap_013122 [Stephania japonica]|uniref:Uncharacterized protein n=1 Tax=Stephania japonica TaxID=461633 RepID=A0AAP0NZK3_9MAGN
MVDQSGSSGNGDLRDSQRKMDEMHQLIMLHGYQLEKVLRILRAQTTIMSPTVIAPVTQRTAKAVEATGEFGERWMRFEICIYVSRVLVMVGIRLVNGLGDFGSVGLVMTSRGVYDSLGSRRHEPGCRKTLETHAGSDVVEPMSHDVSHDIQTRGDLRTDALYDAASDFPKA